MSRRIYCSRCNRHFNAELVQVSNEGGGQWAMPNYCPECQDGHIGERPDLEEDRIRTAVACGMSQARAVLLDAPVAKMFRECFGLGGRR